MGLFSLKDIKPNTWITSYAPLAPVRLGHHHEQTDYIVKTVRNGSEVEVDGKLCPLGLGRLVQDGTFPFILAPEKFGALVKSRLNCEWANRDGTIWFRSSRHIKAGEELYTRYSHDNSYWLLQYGREACQQLRQALMTAQRGSLGEAEMILRGFSFS